MKHSHRQQEAKAPASPHLLCTVIIAMSKPWQVIQFTGQHIEGLGICHNSVSTVMTVDVLGLCGLVAMI